MHIKPMKRTAFITILVTLLTLVCGSASAQNAPRLRMEWGFVAGVSYPFMKYEIENSEAKLSPRLGYSAGLHMALKFSDTFAIQPEIIYTYSKIKLADEPQKFSSTIKSNTIQVPILFSFRFSKFRVGLGPVLTVMDNPTYADRKGEKVLFGRLNPTVSYAVSVGCLLFKHLLIDARFMSRFNKVENYLSYDATSEGTTFDTTTHYVQLRIGYLF